MKYFLLTWIARVLAAPILKWWFRSLKWEILAGEEWAGTAIIGFWHRDIFAAIGFLSRLTALKPMTALVSASGDGDILSVILNRFDFNVVRGSSSQDGFPAVVKLDAALELRSVLITPDGPKGPARALKPGIIHLARYSRKPVVLIRVEYASIWELKSWDRFVIPKPFSACRIILSKALYADRGATHPAALTEEMEEILNGCKSRAAMEESVH